MGNARQGEEAASGGQKAGSELHGHYYLYGQQNPFNLKIRTSNLWSFLFFPEKGIILREAAETLLRHRV
jgi:hypothetical protein